MDKITFQTRLSKIGFQKQLRLDTKYRFFKDIKNNETELLRLTKTKGIPLKNILEISHNKIVKKGELEDNMILIELDDIEPGFGIIKQERIVTEVTSDKTIFGNSDIICSKLTPEKGHFFINNKEKKYIGSTEFIGYNLKKNSNWDIKFLLYILLHKNFRNDLELLTYGKTHPRIQISDFLSMLIPSIEISKQREIVKKIEEKEKEILDFKSKIKTLQDIIDNVFEKYGYPTKSWLNRDEKYCLNFKLKNISKTNLLSIRPYLCKFIEEELPKFIIKNLKGKYIPFNKYVKKIRSGEYIPKQYYSYDETNFIYLRINNISSNGLNLEEPIYLKNKIGEQYKDISIEENNLILTRSGTVGKCIIFNSTQKDNKIFIPSHHLAIIELKDNKDALFLNYYLQSSFCYDFFWAFSTGKSQKEITNFSIKSLPIPEIDKKTIEKIVSEIQQLEKNNNKYILEMKKLREEIDNLIIDNLVNDSLC